MKEIKKSSLQEPAGIKNGAKMHYHANSHRKRVAMAIFVTNPTRDAMIKFLKASLSAGFRTKRLYFSCIKNYKELKNHHFLTNPTELTY